MDPMDHEHDAMPSSGGMGPPRLLPPTSSHFPTSLSLPARGASRPGVPGMASDDTDAGVRATNDDAQVSKLSAVNRGYFEDPFVELFVRRPQRRSPLINRGYWARHAVMRRLILAFLRHYAPAEEAAASAAAAAQPPPRPTPPQPPFEPTCQVVVLGAGYDTTWLQLCREHDAFAAGTTAAATTAAAATAATPDPGAGGGVRPGRDVADPRARVRWVEVDFPEVVASKARVLLSGGGSGGRQQHQQTPPPPQAATAAAPAPSLLFPPRPSHATTTAAAAEQAAALVRAQLPNPSSPSSSSTSSSRPPPEILGRAYASVGCDLRSPPDRGLGPALVRAGAAVAVAVAPSDGSGDQSFSLRLPTLFVAECVLAYLEPGEARALLEFLGRCAAATTGGDGNGNSTTNCGVPAAVLAYDVVSPDDPFGRQMQANLAARGCPMRGAAAAPDPSAQAARLRAALSLSSSQQPPLPGVSVEADALDMSDVWSRTLAVDLEASAAGAEEAASAAPPPPPAPFPRPPLQQHNERRRAERLEPLDELEEWELFGRHYCVALGVREPQMGEGGEAPLWVALRAALRPRG